EDTEEASQSALHTICEELNWDLGQLWVVNEEKSALVCIQSWHRPELNLDSFIKDSLEHTISRQEGITGKVWESGEPNWLSDISTDSEFTRAETAKASGLTSGVCFPLVIGNV